MKYQYTHWDDPVDSLVKNGRITLPSRRDVISLEGFSAAAGIERVDYTRVSDGLPQVAYVVWQSNKVDEVVYLWVTGHLSKYSAAKMLHKTGVYHSILRQYISRGLQF